MQFAYFRVPSFGFMVAIGALVAIYLYIFPRAERHGFKKDDLYDLAFYTALAGLAGSKVFYDIIHWNSFGVDLASRAAFALRNFQYGFVFYAGIIFAAPVFLLITYSRKLSLPRVADLFSPALALANVFGQTGCLLAGCCYGAPAGKFPLAIVFHDPACNVPAALLGVPLYPTQILEAAGNLVIFALLHLALGKKLRSGSVVALYAALYSVQRFLTEFLRGDAHGARHFGLSQDQLIAIAGFSVAVVLLLKLLPQAKNLKA
jgi:phosphatidylglycerol:prolipoprotein diacylglycerol transferase